MAGTLAGFSLCSVGPRILRTQKRGGSGSSAWARGTGVHQPSARYSKVALVVNMSAARPKACYLGHPAGGAEPAGRMAAKTAPPRRCRARRTVSQWGQHTWWMTNKHCRRPACLASRMSWLFILGSLCF